jgi:hypothetical protein
MATVTETYDGILAGLHEDFSPQAAEGILTLEFSPAQQERMKELAAKARAGELSDQERVEADNFEQVSSLLGILQSRARMALKRSVS